MASRLNIRVKKITTQLTAKMYYNKNEIIYSTVLLNPLGIIKN